MNGNRPADAQVDATDDGSLVERIVAGDQAVFVGLMRKYNRRLYRLARAVLRDTPEAEDALQEAYLRAYRSLAGFRGEASLATWLSRLVLNECLARKRRSSRRQNVIPIVRTDADTEMNGVAANELTSPDNATARAQLRALLERKVDELPEGYRAIFIMRAVEELSVEETAQCLNLPEATVRSRHFRARSLLRESMALEMDLAERDAFDFGGARCNAIVAQVLARIDRAGTTIP